jgi:hypothetical protein
MDGTSRPSDADLRTIRLPAHVVDRVEERLPRSDFDTVEGYVAFALAEVLAEVESETSTEAYDAVDETEVRSRLESLGYLDE